MHIGWQDIPSTTHDAAGARSKRGPAQQVLFETLVFFADWNRRRAADYRLQPESKGHPETVCALGKARRQDVLWA